MGVSVVITVRNEAAHIEDLLESLVDQPLLDEVILVDAESTDDTVARAQRFEGRLPLQILVEPCTRGRGRNIGAERATGDVLAFIDGDCRAHPGWVEALGTATEDVVVAAGRTTYEGPRVMERVPVWIDGMDVSVPSCNLAYPASLFHAIGGFDESFQTAEDIDLNLRAVGAGARIVHVDEANITARTRPTLSGFLRQAYAYGQGRRRLEAKHPDLPRTSKRRALRGHMHPMGVLRLAAGWLGYRKGDDA